MLLPDSAHSYEKDPALEERMGLALRHDLFAWREMLARNIARNNFDLRSAGIATAVNLIICRILFLRIAEDRELVPTGTLLGLSGSFDPLPSILEATEELDELWADLPPRTPETGGMQNKPMIHPAIEAPVLGKILCRVASPHRPYDFSILSLERVSEVFRVYFCRTVRRSAAHQAIIVDTHDAVLSGCAPGPGPAQIEYLVEATLRQAAAGRSRREILPLRFVDPACGPGRILLSAFSRLTRPGNGADTFDERRQVLADSLHGVDANRHAIAACRMLLALALCGRGTAGLDGGRNLPDVLPDITPVLCRAIRCGNPLVGPEIVHDESWAFCPVRERHQLDPFSWEAAFPEIFAAGGFDAVITNPPEGPVEQKEWIQQYFQRHYAVYDPAVDRSAYFVEKGLALLRPGGTLGCGITDRWMRGKSGGALRSALASNQVEEIVDILGSRDDGDAGLCLLRISHLTPSHRFPVTIVGPGLPVDLAGFIERHRFPVEPSSLDAGGWSLRDTRNEDLLAKLARSGMPLDEVVMGQVHGGAGAGTSGVTGPVVLIDEDVRAGLLRDDPRAKTLVCPIVSAGDIGRYRVASHLFVLRIPEGWTDARNRTSLSPWRWLKRRHPGIARLLKQSRNEPPPRGEGAGYWWETDAGPDVEPRPVILFPAQFRNPAFALDDGRTVADETVGIIGSSGLYLLGVLNSRLIAFILANSPRNRSGKEFFSGEDLRDLPLYTPEPDDPVDRARYDRVVRLVTRMIDRQKRLQRVSAPKDRELLEKEISAIDTNINALVYELYGLTQEEVSVLEAAVE